MLTSELLRQVDVPVGQSGDWEVKRFVVSEDASKFSMIRDGGRYVPAGEYTKLTYEGRVVMSDTHAELMDHYEFAKQAKGDVLINGLGLGVCLQAVIEKPDVTSVTVIEIEQDVINLVASHYLNRYEDKVLIIVNADAYTWQPPKGQRYGAVWHDIWPDMCTDNLKWMSKLHRKYGRRCDWQGSWSRGQLEYRLRQEKRYGWWY